MKKLLSVLLLVGSAFENRAAPFVNLVFEGVNTNLASVFAGKPYPIGFGPVADLLPAWNLTLDGFALVADLPVHIFCPETPCPGLISQEYAAVEPRLFNLYAPNGLHAVP